MNGQTLFIVAVAFFLLPACGGKDEQDKAKSEQEKSGKDLIVIETDKESIRLRNPEDLAEALEKRAKELEQGGNSGLTDFRELKEMLPSRLGWYVRKEHKGQRAGVAGFGASTAEATYVSGNRQFRIQIADPGPMSSLIGMFSDLADLEVDNTTQDGFERTTTINGFKAIEKFEKSSGRGELTMLAGKLVVTLEGENLKPNTLREAAEKLKLKGN